MNKPTIYEQLGVIVPGAVLIFGLMLFFPAVKDLLSANGVSLGEFGMFLILSYAGGHLITAVANIGECAWGIGGGLPTNWVIKPTTRLIASEQVDLIEAKVQLRFSITLPSGVRGAEKKKWFPISRQIHAEVLRHGKTERIETFNGNYGLNRGLAASCFVLACIAALKAEWVPLFILFAFCAIYAYRAYRFGIHYARELYVQFLTIT